MAKQKRSFGKALRSEKFKRGGMATLMSVIFIAIVVILNILMGVLTDRFPSLNVDLTAQKMNTLSDQALEIAKNVEQETSIYLIGSEDAYRNNTMYYSSAYGFDYSQIANLADKLQEANSKISVEFIDPDTNPTFISEYPEDNLVSGKVLVKTEKRHKVLSVNDLFSMQNDQTTGSRNTYSKVDSALAGALEVVNMDKVPVVAIATGHNEVLTPTQRGAFEDKMEAQNFEIREIDFVTEEIPEDTQILMLPTPNTDYTEEEIQKLRDFLDNDTNPESVTLLVTCHPTQGEMPNFDSFLEEWGVKVNRALVAETDSSRMALGSPAYVLVDHEDEILENDYGYLISPSGCGIELLFESNSDISTHALWTTSDTACLATEDMTEADLADAPKASQVVASLSYTTVKVGDVNTRRSVVVFGSSVGFTDSFINATAFDNSTYITDLLKGMTGTDGSQVSVVTEQVQTNVRDVTASQSTVVFWGLIVFTVGLPLAILIVGLVIFLKRRHL